MSHCSVIMDCSADMTNMNKMTSANNRIAVSVNPQHSQQQLSRRPLRPNGGSNSAEEAGQEEVDVLKPLLLRASSLQDPKNLVVPVNRPRRHPWQMQMGSFGERVNSVAYHSLDADEEGLSISEDCNSAEYSGAKHENDESSPKRSTSSALVQVEDLVNLNNIKQLNGDATHQLIDAIESLRESIQDNTNVVMQTVQTRNRRRGTTSTALSNCKSIMTHKNEERSKVRPEKIVVEIRVVFLKIGEIDTLKELYHADAFIQAKWKEPLLEGRTPEELKAMEFDKYWNPMLYIDNILSETKEATWLVAQLDVNGHDVYLVERRRIKGVFLETLELNDFPLDVQDLTITITSERPDTEIQLIPDEAEMSGINIQTFVDQQEWKLHEHIEVEKRTMTQEFSSSMKSHPALAVRCRAARRPGYFYWNVFLIMFFITGLSFATFAVARHKPESRLQLSFTLFLTSVAFKFVINQALPKISYLTYMDKYVLMSLAILCVVSIWHAVVAKVPCSLMAYNDTSVLRNTGQRLPSSPHMYDENAPQSCSGIVVTASILERVDQIERDVFYSFASLYFLAHLIFFFWLYYDACSRRREMHSKDREYKNRMKFAQLVTHGRRPAIGATLNPSVPSLLPWRKSVVGANLSVTVNQ